MCYLNEEQNTTEAFAKQGYGITKENGETRTKTTMEQPVTSPGQVTVTTSQPPPPVNQTTVIVHQPGAMMRDIGPRVWSSDLCSCFDDIGSCLLGAVCPLALACQVSGQLGESACVPCCVPGALVVLRTKLRIEQNIQGTVMDDCCMTTFCGPCALCQMSREIDYIRNMQQ
ncbi:cornifelin homolog A-like isoform X3 [Haliotis rubra]|uniref:cornifelin homolog A-like isoform X3 n=2 Tax=Haliotis rubra TaxID=36100 RepID=UPI001EE558BA|nr:cornifelin homolog A-like isoform X3 [Haliotis rubra]